MTRTTRLLGWTTVSSLAYNLVTFQVEDPATIAGTRNGDHLGLDCFTDNEHPLFYSKAMLILRSMAIAPSAQSLKLRCCNFDSSSCS
jgi:hypothetical protein